MSLVGRMSVQCEGRRCGSLYSIDRRFGMIMHATTKIRSARIN